MAARNVRYRRAISRSQSPAKVRTRLAQLTSQAPVEFRPLAQGVHPQRTVPSSLSAGGVRTDRDAVEDGLDAGAAPVGVPVLPSVADGVGRRDIGEHGCGAGEPVVFGARPVDAVVGALLDV